MSTKRLIIAMSGASGQIYGIRLLEVLREAPEVETHLLMSPAARITIAQETDWDPRDVEALADVIYRPGDIGAALASGSFETAGMIVAPCSIKTLSAIAHNALVSDLCAPPTYSLARRPVLLMVRGRRCALGHIELIPRRQR
jgi:4-hydroxy-3-polyprenylbenzoate decarboxylase